MKDIIQKRLEKYALNTLDEEQSALREILQEIILYALSSCSFFGVAAFNGGTSLRILHGLNRFSEDLDFLLKKPDPEFQWGNYRDAILSTCEEFGLEAEFIDKKKLSTSVQKIFLKDNSIGKMLSLKFHHHSGQKFSIKLEIDTNPPEHSSYKIYYHDFPLDFSILAQDLPSNFSGKLHALLCRKYVKGRDWYDFNWYLKQGIPPNVEFLKSALSQQGPWAGETLEISLDWLRQKLNEKINSINWADAINDVSPFLSPKEKESTKLWSAEFFLERTSKISNLLVK